MAQREMRRRTYINFGINNELYLVVLPKRGCFSEYSEYFPIALAQI